jgi:hypothetical protein
MEKHQLKETPPHYCGISLRNFRSFKKADNIQLGPLTFLVGPNNSGKSSLFHALLLVIQSGFEPSPMGSLTPSWGGPFVDLGSYEDTVFGHNSKLMIEISIDHSSNFFPRMWLARSGGKSKERPIRMILGLRTSKGDPLGRLSVVRVSDLLTGEEVKFLYSTKHLTVEFLGRRRQWTPRGIGGNRFQFISWISGEINSEFKKKSRPIVGPKSALQRILRFLDSFRTSWLFNQTQRVSSGRDAPKRWYAVTDIRFRATRDSSAPKVFSTVDPAILEETRREDYRHHYLRLRPLLPPPSLTSVLRKLEIADAIKPINLSPYHTSINVRDSITEITSNLMDVGYGASQVIPVLQACLSGAEGPLFLEQPEIHLHPKAQGIVAELLCQTSRRRQVIIETHSVHMVNAARILVAKGELNPEHVIINFIKRTSSGSHVYQIPILKNGDFGAVWPEGFFDERYQDTMLLLKLKGKGGQNDGSST